MIKLGMLDLYIQQEYYVFLNRFKKTNITDKATIKSKLHKNAYLYMTSFVCTKNLNVVG